MNENAEVREEPLLKQYLREAVEALRERAEELSDDAKTYAEALEIYRKQGLSHGVLNVTAHNEAEAREELSLTRAALAFWERLAEVEVEAFSGPYRYEEGVCYRTAGMAKVDTPHGEDYSHLWSGVVDDEAGGLRYSVDGYTADITEQQCLCLLAAALECRRRNEGEAILSRSDDEVLADCQARGEDPAEVAQRVKAALMAGVERHFGPKEASNEQP